MDRDPDDGYEILELGHPTDADLQRSVPVLPALDLGDLNSERAGSGTDQSRPPVRWRQWAALAAVFAGGVAVGAYGWDARDQAQEAAAQPRQTDLVAGSVVGGGADGTGLQQIVVMMLNNSPRAIEVLSIEPTGWRAYPRGSTTIGPEEWAGIPMTVTPDCAAPVPLTMSAEVRTEDGEGMIAVAVPPADGVLDGIRQRACGGTASAVYTLSAGRVNALAAAEPGTFRMSVELRPLPPGVDFEVTSVVASTGGVTGAGTNLPLSFVATRRSPSILELTWEVARCELTSLLGDINLEVEITPPDEAPYKTFVELPGQAVAILARFAAEECPD